MDKVQLRRYKFQTAIVIKYPRYYPTRIEVIMSRARNFLIPFSLAAGAAVAFAAWWMRAGRANRSAYASNTEDLLWQAIRQLNVGAESRYVAVNGLELHTVIAGPSDGPLVVLLHGFPENWYTWRNQITFLAKAGYRVVVPDQRGYNLSDKPPGVHNYRVEALAGDIKELIHAFGRDKAIVVGHDWGGVVAWHLAMHHPEVVEKLVVMNAPHPATYSREIRENPAQQQKSWYVGFFQLPLLPEELLGHDPIESANLFFRKGAINQNAFSSFEIHVMATALAQPDALTSMLNWYRAAVRYRASFENVCPIDMPTLLIWAEEDRALGKSLTYGLESWVNHLRIHYIPNCGHWVQNEAAAEVNAQLLTFMQS
jgi:pimeloyl-ACP methyl ester carboxylesterase